MRIKSIIKMVVLPVCLWVVLAFSACHSSKRVKASARQLSTGATLSVSEQRLFSYYFEEAVRQRLAGNYDVAMELLNKCYQIDDKDANVMFELANVYISIGNADMAVHYLSNAINLDDENVWYQLNLASLYLAIDNVPMAIAVYEYAEQKHPEREEVSYALIELYIKQSRYEDALNELDKIEKRRGVTEEISYEKFRIYSHIEENKKAAKEIDALINKYPHEMKYVVLRGNVYFEEGDMQNALALYDEVLAKEPDNGLARLSLAEYYEKESDPDKALNEVNYVLRSPNIDVETKQGILAEYLSLLETSDLWKDKISDLFDALVEIHPNVAEIRLYRASYLMAAERFDEAEDEYKTVLDLAPENIDAYNNIIAIRLDKEDAEGVLEYSQKAIEALPEMPEWHLYEGIAYTLLKQQNKALETYQQGIDLIEKEEDKASKANLLSSIYAQMGDIYSELKRKDLLVESYEKSLQYNPHNAHVLNNYSYFLAVEKRDLSRAETMIKDCLRQTKPSSTVLDTYAWVLFQQGYYNLAKRQIEDAIELDDETDDAVLTEHYGDILYKTGDADKAVEMWKKSLELNNDSEMLPLKIEKREYIESLNP